VAWPFGHPLTFRELLDRLANRCHCTVILQDSGGIPDPQDLGGGRSGELFYVERTHEDILRWAFIEVFHMDVAVLPDYLASICNDLRIAESELGNVN
jgi:hypothetical protein